MTTINLRNLNTVEKRLSKFVNADVPAAQTIAVNKALALAKTRVVRVVAEKAQVKSKSIRQRVTTKKAAIKTAKRRGSSGFISMRTRPVSALSLLGARQTKRGVVSRRMSFPGVFVADGSKGTGRKNWGGRYKQLAYRRLTKKRYKIVGVTAPIREQVKNNMPEVVNQVFNQNFSRLYSHELKRLAGKT